jgi:hypothetical protein
MKKHFFILGLLGIALCIVGVILINALKYYSLTAFFYILLGFLFMFWLVFNIAKLFKKMSLSALYGITIILNAVFIAIFYLLKLINENLDLFSKGNYPSLNIFRLIVFHFVYLPYVLLVSTILAKTFSDIFQLTHAREFKYSSLLLLSSSLLLFIGYEIAIVPSIVFPISLTALLTYIWKIGFISSFALLFMGFIRFHRLLQAA